jgi:hypothetical protein
VTYGCHHSRHNDRKFQVPINCSFTFDYTGHCGRRTPSLERQGTLYDEDYTGDDTAQYNYVDQHSSNSNYPYSYTVSAPDHHEIFQEEFEANPPNNDGPLHCSYQADGDRFVCINFLFAIQRGNAARILATIPPSEKNSD